jgi:hypothetical protein
VTADFYDVEFVRPDHRSLLRFLSLCLRNMGETPRARLAEETFLQKTNPFRLVGHFPAKI